MILRNISWLALAQFVRLTLGILVGAWLTRTIGAAQNGLLGTAVVVVALCGFIADFGIRHVLIKELAARPEDAPRLFGTAARITTLLGVLMLGVAVSVCWLWGGGRMALLGMILGFPLFLNGWLAVLSRWDADHQAHRTAKVGLIANLISNAAKIVCVLTGANLTFAAATFAFDTLLGAIFAYSWAVRHGWLKDLKKWDTAFAKSLLQESLPLFLSHCGTLLLLRVDQLMVFNIAGDTEAGIYAAATRLSEVVYAIGPMIILTFLPSLSESHAKDPTRYTRQFGVLFGILTSIAYISILCWWALGDWVVQLLYGPAFYSAAAIILIHCVAALPYLHGELRNALLVVEKRSHSGAKAALVGIIVNVLLNLWLIPLHGAAGAAWATVATYTAVWFGGSLLMPSLRHIGLQQLRSLTAPLWIWKAHHWISLRRVAPLAFGGEKTITP